MRSNLKEETATFLRDRIFAGELHPGDRIDQDAVADELGISRLPVREAIITLEAEGLIETLPRRGAFVAPLTPDDVLDHYLIYGTLTGLAARRAATALSEADLALLDDLIKRMEASSEPAEQEDLNFQFHQVINKAGSSNRLRLVLRMLSSSMPSRFFEFTEDWGPRALVEHRAIVVALRSRNAGAAAEAVSDHLRSGGEQAVGMLRSAGFWEQA